MDTADRNNFFFFFNSQCYACKSPGFLFLSEYKKVLHVRIITWIAQRRNEIHVSESGSNFVTPQATSPPAVARLECEEGGFGRDQTLLPHQTACERPQAVRSQKRVLE